MAAVASRELSVHDRWSEGDVAFPLNRWGLARAHTGELTLLVAFACSPVAVLVALDPGTRWLGLGWLVLVAVGFAAAGSSMSAAITCFRRRSPVVMTADGIDLGCRGAVPWDAVLGLHVEADQLALQLTHAELARRGWDGPYDYDFSRPVIAVPLAWVEAEPAEIMAQARRFIAAGDAR